MVVKIVQADLAPRDDLGIFGQPFHLRKIGVGSQLGLMRMDAERGIDTVMLPRYFDGAVKRARPGPAADGQDAFQPGFVGAGEHLRTVRVKLGPFQMSVRIDVHEFSSIELMLMMPQSSVRYRDGN